MDKDFSTHFEKGSISEQNHRLINHSILGLAFPEFIPQLVVPDNKMLADMKNRSFPVTNGGVQLMDVAKTYSYFNESDLIHIYLLAIKEIETVLMSTGIFIGDRHGANIMFKQLGNTSSGEFLVEINGKKYTVLQVDLESVYDTAIPTSKYQAGNLNPNINYLARNKSEIRKLVQSSRRLRQDIEFELLTMLKGLHYNLSKLWTLQNKDNMLLSQRISHFIDERESIFNRVNDKYLDFEGMRQFLNSLVKDQIE